MTSPTNSFDPVPGWLKDAYPSPQPPAEMADEVWAEVQRGLDAAPVAARIKSCATVESPRTFWGMLMAHKFASVTAAAAVCAMAVTTGVILANRSPGKANDAQAGKTAKTPSARSAASTVGPAAAIELRPIDDRGPGQTDLIASSVTNAPPFETTVANAQVIVVAKFLDFTGVPAPQKGDFDHWVIRFRAMRTLKGKLANDVVTVQMPKFALEPEQVARDRILFLSAQFLAGQTPYVDGFGPVNDEEEAQVRSILAAQQAAAATAPAHKSLVVSAPPQGNAAGLGMRSDSVSIGLAPLIVRARVAGWEKGKIRLDVVRVICGDLTADRVWLTNEWVAGNHEPNEEELKRDGMAKGKEMILCLRALPAKSGEETLYFPISIFHDTPLSPRLDGVEAGVVRDIAAGTFLSPPVGDTEALMDQVQEASLIARAQLAAVTEKESRWTIVETLKGEASKKTLIIPHDLFRLRAEAIVRHARAAPPPATNPATQPAVEQQVATEMKRLIAAELVPNLQAILFVSETRVEDEALRGRLRQRIFEDASGKRLDEATMAIREAENHIPPNIPENAAW